MARDGIADIAFVNPGYQAGRFPIIAHGEIPFLITNAKGGLKALDAWYREYADEEMGDVKFLHGFPARARHLPREGQARPARGRGRQEHPAGARDHRTLRQHAGRGERLGAGTGSARDIGQGAADAITFPWNSLYIFGIDGITTHHLDIPLYVTTFVLVMNKTRYEGLADADRQVIDEHCTSEWAEKMASGWADWEDEGRTKMLADLSTMCTSRRPRTCRPWRDAAAPCSMPGRPMSRPRAMTTPSMRR